MIELQNISKVYYPGKASVSALCGISLTIKTGEFVVVAGASGSGKSTLLNMIGLIDEPCEGKVFIDTMETTNRKEKELVKLRRDYLGFIFQNFNLIPTLNVFENVEQPLLNLAQDVAQRKKLVDETLESVGLSDFARRYPDEISGGQQQRVSIARAFAKNPAIVIADEPTANLDSVTSASILELMEKMNREREVTFILASHDPDVLSLAHRQILMKDGQIIEDKNRNAPEEAGKTLQTTKGA